MAEFLLEAYASDLSAAESGVERLRACATRMRAAGTPVHVLRAIFLPEDETNLVLFRAPSSDVVRAALRDAGLPADRIATAVLAPGGEEPCV